MKQQTAITTERAEYLLINFKNRYAIAKKIESTASSENIKNSHLVELLDSTSSTNTIVKIKASQLIYLLPNISNIKQFVGDVNTLSTSIDIELLSELLEVAKVYSLDDLFYLYFSDADATNTTNHLIKRTALLFSLAQHNSIMCDYHNASFSKYNEEEQRKYQEIIAKQQQRTDEYEDYLSLLRTKHISNLNSDDLFKLQNINLIKLLHRPDKHAPIYKALQVVATEANLSPLNVCYNLGLIPDLAEFFLACFRYDNNFVSMTTADTVNENNLSLALPLITDWVDSNHLVNENSAIQAFSIDDSNTTEIDDAFSLQITETGYSVGIHIAAPALNSVLTTIATKQLSTIYFPNGKITMFPDAVIKQYSLNEKQIMPVVSIYFALDNGLNIVNFSSKLETIYIAANLRIEQLEEFFAKVDPNQLTPNSTATNTYDNGQSVPFARELLILLQFANRLEQTRGKTTTNILEIDYTFDFIDNKIIPKQRIRGNPIDKLVSELMILANCSWGRMLTNAFLPAIYRVKQPNYPVQMTINPGAHSSLNVDYYTWATSPLRRAVDYVNQHQIIAMLTNPKLGYSKMDENLLTVSNDFDKTYSKYQEFQEKMERYWSLKYLLQEQLEIITATIIHKATAQLDVVPITIDLNTITSNTEQYQRGSKLKLKIYAINFIDVTFQIKLLTTADG